ncbi:MAG: SIS domain-containing protein [Pseudomonadota bacterium]|jgi:arabinose-5-phosphate isomerase
MTSNPPTKSAADQLADVRYGRDILRQQIEAITRIADSLDSHFAQAVEVLLSLESTSRIVVSGMGKAGYVGMKLSSTLASIGFPSFFLHPADAIHGDLGRLQRNDVVLILSHSGETDEVVRLLPRIKRFGARILSITSSSSSSLGRHSDVVIATGRIPEAGPLGLAPTTSTTVMLALSDALAMTLLERKGISREEYAAFHPGGDLGRSLMLVEEIMRTGSSVCVVTEDTVNSKALHNITATEGRPGCAAVVNSNGEIVGVFTDGDLRRCLEREADFLNKTIGSVCSRAPITIHTDQLAQEACRIIQERKVNQLFVIDRTKKPVGLVHIQDLLAHGMIRPDAAK